MKTIFINTIKSNEFRQQIRRYYSQLQWMYKSVLCLYVLTAENNNSQRGKKKIVEEEEEEKKKSWKIYSKKNTNVYRENDFGC